MKMLGKSVVLAIVLFGSTVALGEGGDPVECARKAINAVSLSSEQAVKLCVNGGTLESVDCATKAMKEVGLSGDQAVELCANKTLRLQNMVNFVAPH